MSIKIPERFQGNRTYDGRQSWMWSADYQAHRGSKRLRMLRKNRLCFQQNVRKTTTLLPYTRPNSFQSESPTWLQYEIWAERDSYFVDKVLSFWFSKSVRWWSVSCTILRSSLYTSFLAFIVIIYVGSITYQRACRTAESKDDCVWDYTLISAVFVCDSKTLHNKSGASSSTISCYEFPQGPVMYQEIIYSVYPLLRLD